MPKVTIPYTCTINSKIYFAGEVEMGEKEAESVETFLKSLPGDNVEPLTGTLLPVTDSPLPATKEADSKKKGKAASDDEEEA